MGEVEIGDGIEVAAGRVEGAVFDGQGTEQVPEAKPEEAESRIQVEDVGRGQDAHAATFEDAVKIAEDFAVTFEVFHDFGERFQEHLQELCECREVSRSESEL